MSFLLNPVYAGYRAFFAESQLTMWRPLFVKGSAFRAKWFNIAHRSVLAAAIPLFLANIYLFFLATPETLDALLVPYIEGVLLWWALPFQGILLVSASLATHPGEVSQINRTHSGINTYLVVWTGILLLLGVYWVLNCVLGTLVSLLFLLVYPLVLVHLEQAFTGIAVDYMSLRDRGLREGLTWCFRLLLLAALVPGVEGLAAQVDWSVYLGSSL